MITPCSRRTSWETRGWSCAPMRRASTSTVLMLSPAPFPQIPTSMMFPLPAPSGATRLAGLDAWTRPEGVAAAATLALERQPGAVFDCLGLVSRRSLLRKARIDRQARALDRRGGSAAAATAAARGDADGKRRDGYRRHQPTCSQSSPPSRGSETAGSYSQSAATGNPRASGFSGGGAHAQEGEAAAEAAVAREAPGGHVATRLHPVAAEHRSTGARAQRGPRDVQRVP